MKSMPLVPMRTLLDHAAENGYGIAAFNVNDISPEPTEYLGRQCSHPPTREIENAQSR